tara:strand:- start:5975 stop:6430 length:456 start_codon:yes stop_codon:yes gene_type:complete
MNNNFKRKKLDTYTGALVDTPFNRKVQERLDYWNALLPKEVKLYGFQDEQSKSTTIIIMALATKYCKKNLIGGDYKVDKGDFYEYYNSKVVDKKLPKDTISNYLGMGLKGEVALGYKFLLKDLESYMIKYMDKKCKEVEIQKKLKKYLHST